MNMRKSLKAERNEMKKLKEEVREGKLNAEKLQKDVEKMKSDLAREREKNKSQENIINTFFEMKKKIDSLEQ